MDNDTRNELISGAREDANETFLEEPLGYWYSGPGVPGEAFPPEPQRRWADGWVSCFDGRKATQEEWVLYRDRYNDAIRVAEKYVEKNWNPDGEEDHYEEVVDAVVELLAQS